MLKAQRQETILSELHKRKSISIEDVIAMTDGSRSTARRDLEEMEQAHLLRRVRGGAMAITSINTHVVSSDAEIQTNRLMLKAAQQIIVLCGHSKFERVAFVNICKLEDIGLLITGREIGPKYLDQLKSRNVRVMAV